MQDMHGLIGKQFGEFTIEDYVGRGGMGTVYRAVQESVQRQVAVKVIALDDKLARDKRFNERFANEARLIASLEHIHILPVYAYGIQDGFAYLAMRYLAGGALRDRLADGPMSIRPALRTFEQIARGLAFAHSRGIIHRDLKPGNILLDTQDNAYLCDFGLAKLISNDQGITQTDSIMGTLAYMSPEHLQGKRIDHRSDIYSMGIVFYQMLTGSVPFDHGLDDMVAVIYKHLQVVPALPSTLNPNIPPALDAVIMKALKKEPDDRYANIGDMVVSALLAVGLPSIENDSYPSAVATIEEQLRTPTEQVSPQLPEPLRRRPIWPVAVGLLAVVALAIFLVWRGTRPVLTQFTIERGTSARWDALAPTEEHIAVARQRLADTNFLAVLACNQDSEYHATLTREIITRAQDYQLATRVYNADSDAYQQRILMERALTEGAIAFFICPLDYQLLAEPLAVIERRNYPIVSSGGASDVYHGVVTSNETSDFAMGEAVGLATGEYINAALNGRAEVIILDFPDMQAIVERANGIEVGIRSVAPGADIIGRYRGATQAFAEESIGQLLALGTHFDVVASINDAGSYGVVTALARAGIGPGAVAIFSIDAEQRAVDYVRRHYYFRGTLTVGRSEVAVAVVDMLTRMLAGDVVPEIIIIPPGRMIMNAGQVPEL